MPAILIIEAVLKAAVLALGVAAQRGCHWAFVVFLTLMGLMIVFDAVIGIAAIRFGKDSRRWEL